MIQVKQTIYKTLKNVIDKMRLLGEQNPKTIKKLLYLAILDDVYEWSVYKEESQRIQKQLKEKRINFILENCDLDLQKVIKVNSYTNVNTPQNTHTWRVINPTRELYGVENDPLKYVPCSEWVRSNYVGILKPKQKTFISKPNQGYDGPFSPEECETLTNQERMDIYFDERTGLWYWMKDGCKFEVMNKTFVESLPSGIKSELSGDDDQKLTISLTADTTQTSTVIDVLDPNEIDDVL